MIEDVQPLQTAGSAFKGTLLEQTTLLWTNEKKNPAKLQEGREE